MSKVSYGQIYKNSAKYKQVDTGFSSTGAQINERNKINVES